MTGYELRYITDFAAYTLLLCLVAAVFRSSFPRRVRNFRGDTIPTGYGVYVAAVAIAAGVAAGRSGIWPPRYLIGYLVATATMAVTGALDDVISSHGGGGFAGHFRQLFVHGRLTTGMVKLVLGVAASLLAAYYLRPAHEPWHHLVVDGGLIAASANFINLLDLRPGRASWSFLILTILMCASPFFPLPFWVLAPAAAGVIWWLPADMKGRQIMGDSGSTVLGAVLGCSVVMLHDLPLRLIVFALLLLIHLYAEKRSISHLIDSNSLLRAIDRRFGVR